MFVRSQLQVHSIANVDVSTSFCIKFYQLSACRLLTMTMLSVANQLLFARAVVQCIIFDMIPLCLMCIHTCTYMTWSAVITAMSEMLCKHRQTVLHGMHIWLSGAHGMHWASSWNLWYIYTVNHKKRWQYICNHNFGKSWWILIIFTYLETGINTLCK